jgi:hypothetical protein
MEINEIWYGHYAIGDWRRLTVFNYLHSEI